METKWKWQRCHFHFASVWFAFKFIFPVIVNLILNGLRNPEKQTGCQESCSLRKTIPVGKIPVLLTCVMFSHIPPLTSLLFCRG